MHEIMIAVIISHLQQQNVIKILDIQIEDNLAMTEMKNINVLRWVYFKKDYIS